MKPKLNISEPITRPSPSSVYEINEDKKYKIKI